jgi:hypothetical protein
MGMLETQGAREAPCLLEETVGGSERRIGFLNAVGIRRDVGAALLTQEFLQMNLIAAADRLAQIIEQFDHGQRLLWRPVIRDNEGDSALNP